MEVDAHGIDGRVQRPGLKDQDQAEPRTDVPSSSNVELRERHRRLIKDPPDPGVPEVPRLIRICQRRWDRQAVVNHGLIDDADAKPKLERLRTQAGRKGNVTDQPQDRRLAAWDRDQVWRRDVGE